jgi:integrase/recombinase XerD
LAPHGKPVTAEEREQPRSQPQALLDLEQQARRAKPNQLALFTELPTGELTALPGGLTPLRSESPFELGRAWYRTHLEDQRRPANTIDSYSYDLVRFEDQVGHKPLNQIGRSDIARFLGEASNKATRKRRLTTLRRFFRYLTDEVKVLSVDPTEGFFPHVIPLKTPMPLFEQEQAALLEAAAEDEPWSLAAIWLMMRLGLSRAELLDLHREQIDLSDPAAPVIYLIPDSAIKRNKERRLAADNTFLAIYEAFLGATDPVDRLFPFGFQAINGMVERVAKKAGITRQVTPQTLRHTFAVERARAGADESDLIQLLGLADDPRNRESVRRYLKLAEPPL